ncbi:uncharacterized protein L969DRAFT_96694 [Mixia osmundae IAM 14324]|uniref:PPM-type phosphatase domain-containing protein n=1 Tax=Mixia osmundae (strain CBS 9802 / IAM 14324 / JCM 22182 / KY 12970) TaxID=764103 RepID=G7DSW0_MIXOS|nr:uncharacterized protein L969DRAFT_96694 [Mixia osmundae IAM 14324]KEI37126.1 hypothetical protein L969DRAFT_96694 [Mixia osmundae IAM 14324]GAA93670.1 hypothetical protein E5Q_00315 [Mixia osmundae IAM 14324]
MLRGCRPCCEAQSWLVASRRSAARQRRQLSDAQEFRSDKGSLKLSLKSAHLIGIAQSRGERPYQEDAYSVKSLDLSTAELQRTLKRTENSSAAAWKGKAKASSEPTTEQVAYFAVFDGHGTDQVSHYLRDHLHELLETAKASDVPAAVETYKKVGGYLRRFKGGLLERLAQGTDGLEEPERVLALDERATLAFIQADETVMADEEITDSGSVATAVLLHSLDIPATPFFGASLLALTTAHVGDTRALLTSTKTGRITVLTENHHPDSRVEAERLRRIGTGLVTDSFGESRWGGALANTRGIGDEKFKRLGVVAEPDVTTRVLKGEEWSSLILLSDGISGVISDQETADLIRGISDPTKAAQAIVNFVEEVGGEDNMTAIVVPLPGWRKVGGSDSTASRREFRLRQNVGQSARARRM